MRRRIRSSPVPFVAPVAMARLFAASWETIMRRSLLMAQETCSQAEYRAWWPRRWRPCKWPQERSSEGRDRQRSSPRS